MKMSGQLELKYFIPIYGSYYHFITESALGLYHMLKKAGRLESLDCHLWYQGGFGEIVQLFSCRPITRLQLVKPYLKNGDSICNGVATLRHKRLNQPHELRRLISLVDFIDGKVPYVREDPGITLIRRTSRREYAETDDLKVRLSLLGLPVRVVQFEKLSFSEQVNTARNTRLLIAPHGAGTLNQIFMPSGSKIIELFPLGYENWHAKAIANIFGHELREIEANAPGVVGRMRDERVRDFISQHGWPTRETVAKHDKYFGKELMRTVRDVASFTIAPDRIVKLAKTMLGTPQPP